MKKSFPVCLFILLSIRVLYGFVNFTTFNQTLPFNSFLQGSNLTIIEYLSWIFVIVGIIEYIFKATNKYKEYKKNTK
jgi:hypothetical protein